MRYITGVKPVRALEVLLELKELIKEITGMQPQHGAPIPSPLLEKTAQIVVKDSPANNCILPTDKIAIIAPICILSIMFS